MALLLLRDPQVEGPRSCWSKASAGGLPPSPQGLPRPCGQMSGASSSRGHADLSREMPAELPLAPQVTAHSPLFQDKEVTEILATAGNVITLTIIPSVIYEHMVKK